MMLQWTVLAAAMLAALGASARSYDGYGRQYDDNLPWGSAWRDCYDCYGRWHVLRDGFYGGPRLERSAYGHRPEANLVVSRQCVGFALPPNALQFLGYETAAYVRWRVDDRNVRYGTFAVRQGSNGIDLCAADTIVKNWEKRLAKDIMGTGDGDLFKDGSPPRLLQVEFQGGDSVAPGHYVERSFHLDGVRRAACRHRALPKKRLRACGEAQ